MADSVNWDVILRLAVQGAKGSKQELEGVVGAAENLARQGRVTEKTLESTTRAFNRAGSGAGSANTAYDRFTQGSVALRYANYDVASTMFTVAGAFTAAGTAATVAFASQEAAFTTVERIVSGSSSEIAGLREELLGLSTDIPRSFQDLSRIASLGAALDIPAQSLDEFTDVVARFAATTGVTEEAAATGFGRIAQYLKVPTEEFENLGSAILRAGNISVATEEQVLKFTQTLAPAAARVGFTTEQTVALGAAIASFGNINVEGAGSALSRITNDIERATALGGEELDKFAQAAGMSAEQFRIAWESDASGAFNSILRNLSTVENLTVVLDQLGVVNERDRRVIQALAQNYSAFNGILGQTTSAWREGTYMSEAYGLVLDDLVSKWGIFVNALTNAAAAVGSSAAPALKTLLDISTDLLVNFADFATSDAGTAFFRFAGAIAIVVTAYAALRGVIALATASQLALNFAARQLGGAGIMAGLRGLASALGLYKGTADGATKSTWSLRGALLGLGRATLVIGLLQGIAELAFNTGEAVEWLGIRIRELGNFLDDTYRMLGPLSGLVSVWLPLGGAIRDAGAGMATWGAANRKANEETYGLGETIGGTTGLVDDFGESLDGLGDSAGAAAERVYTLADYASDLGGVLNRAFEIRYNPQSTLDAITLSFIEMATATDEAARNISRIKAEIGGLESDLNIQQRFLAIAVQYQDYDRAQAIQANIAKLQADIADQTAELTDAQNANSKTLTGNSRAAITNRQTIEGLVQQYQQHIAALASSGLSQEELARRTEELRQDFITQATQLGYNRAELALYEQSFRDVTVAIQNIPRDITVNFNADPALQAVNEFAARAASAMQSAGQSAGSSFATGFGRGLTDAEALVAASVRSAFSSIGLAFGTSLTGRSVRGSGSFAGGGFTGRGGKYDPAGIVHRGEYVVPKQHVNQRTGLPYADAMGRLQRGVSGRSGYAGGGFVSGGAGFDGRIQAFGPMALQQIISALRVDVNLGAAQVAQTTSRQYAHNTNVGAN